MFSQYIDELNSRKPISAEEELRLFQLYSSGDKAAGRALVEAHYRLSLIIALEFVKRGGELQELFQEGILGLYEALEKFEADKGARFASYASWWVRKHIQHHFINNSRQVVVPPHVIDQIVKITNTSAEESESETATRLCLTEKKVQQLKSYLRVEMSLNADVSGDEDGKYPLSQLIRDDHQLCSRDYAQRRDDVERIRHVMQSRLNPPEFSVLCYRFGLCGSPEMTLEDASAILGLSIARVQQTERVALEKLKEGMNSALI